jgi:hypothetical protein
MLDGVIVIEIAEKRCRILLAGGLRVPPPASIIPPTLGDIGG